MYLCLNFEINKVSAQLFIKYPRVQLDNLKEQINNVKDANGIIVEKSDNAESDEGDPCLFEIRMMFLLVW